MNQQNGYFGHRFLSSVIGHRPKQRGVVLKAISNFFNPGTFYQHGDRVNSLIKLFHKNGAKVTGQGAKNIVTQLTNYILWTPHGGEFASSEVQNIKKMIENVPSQRKYVRSAILSALGKHKNDLGFSRTQERICVLMRENIFIPKRSDTELITTYAIEPPEMKKYYGKEKDVVQSCQEILTVLLETQPKQRRTALRTAKMKGSSIVQDILHA
jgi:hypothetical protein